MIDLPGYEGLYAITEEGRIWSRRHPFTDNHGYLQIKLVWNGKRKAFVVHRLVAVVFIGPQPSPKHQINHKDGNKANCRASNLEWCTASENMKHAWATGLIKETPAKRAAALRTIMEVNERKRAIKAVSGA